jgi:hypothetical protein
MKAAYLPWLHMHQPMVFTEDNQLIGNLEKMFNSDDSWQWRTETLPSGLRILNTKENTQRLQLTILEFSWKTSKRQENRSLNWTWKEMQ